MALGLFGKLPARRDFIAADVPRAFLTPWETWLEAALRASQLALDDRWPAAYHAAPPWRFWLGRSHCGVAALGVFASSHDGVGRQYPLTLVATGEIAAPDVAAHDDWLSSLEAFLAVAVTPGHAYNEILALTARLAAPSVSPGGPPDQLRFEPLDRVERPPSGDDRTYWWTAGNSSMPPKAIVLDGMPAAEHYTAMLTGRWPAAPGSA